MLIRSFGLIDEPIKVIGQAILYMAKHHGSSHDAWYRVGWDATMLSPTEDGNWRPQI